MTIFEEVIRKRFGNKTVNDEERKRAIGEFFKSLFRKENIFNVFEYNRGRLYTESQLAERLRSLGLNKNLVPELVSTKGVGSDSDMSYFFQYEGLKKGMKTYRIMRYDSFPDHCFAL